jgi:hypothetical protein
MSEGLIVIGALLMLVVIWYVAFKQAPVPPVVPLRPPPVVEGDEVAAAVERAGEVVEALEAPVEVSDEDLKGLVDGSGDEPDLDVLRALQGARGDDPG